MSSLLVNVLGGSIAAVCNTHSISSAAVPPPSPSTGTATESVGKPQLDTILSTSGKEQQDYKAIEPDLHITCFIHVSAFALFIHYFVVFCAETAEASVSSLKRPPAHGQGRDIEEEITCTKRCS